MALFHRTNLDFLLPFNHFREKSDTAQVCETRMGNFRKWFSKESNRRGMTRLLSFMRKSDFHFFLRRISAVSTKKNMFSLLSNMFLKMLDSTLPLALKFKTDFTTKFLRQQIIFNLQILGLRYVNLMILWLLPSSIYLNLEAPLLIGLLSLLSHVYVKGKKGKMSNIGFSPDHNLEEEE